MTDPSTIASRLSEALWAALKQQCCVDPEKATRLVMVSKDDVLAAVRALISED